MSRHFTQEELENIVKLRDGDEHLDWSIIRERTGFANSAVRIAYRRYKKKLQSAEAQPAAKAHLPAREEGKKMLRKKSNGLKKKRVQYDLTSTSQKQLASLTEYLECASEAETIRKLLKLGMRLKSYEESGYQHKEEKGEQAIIVPPLKVLASL